MTGRMNYHSLHAEMHALFKSLKMYNKTNRFKTNYKKLKRPSSTIYVVRILRDVENIPKLQGYWFGNAKPCVHCQTYLSSHNVTKIKYTDMVDGKNVLCEMKLK